MNKKTYDPRSTPKPGEYVYVSGRAPIDGAARIVRGTEEGTLLAEFLDADPKLHDGNGYIPLGKKHHCWWVGKEEIRPLDVSCQILQHGNEIYCQRSDKDRITGRAKCDDNDTFDPVVGAIIALSRAYGVHPTKAAYKVLQVMSAVPKETTSLKIVDRDGQSYGIPGTPTLFKDKKGTRLCVGDTVKVSSRYYEYMTWVVDSEPQGQFIMGIAMDCKGKTGLVDKDWILTLEKSWKEPRPGDREGHGLKIVGGQEKTPAPKKKRLYLETTYHKRAGDLGGRTDLVDMFGTALRVGDIVQIISSARGDQGEEPVVAEAPGIYHPFVMGLGSQKFPAGTTVTKDGFAIRKVKSYEELKAGDKLSDGWITVKEEEV